MRGGGGVGGWKGKGKQKVTVKVVQSVDRKVNFCSRDVVPYLAFFSLKLASLVSSEERKLVDQVTTCKDILRYCL